MLLQVPGTKSWLITGGMFHRLCVFSPLRIVELIAQRGNKKDTRQWEMQEGSKCTTNRQRERERKKKKKKKEKRLVRPRHCASV
jgi:hypothetical protein